MIFKVSNCKQYNLVVGVLQYNIYFINPNKVFNYLENKLKQ